MGMLLEVGAADAQAVDLDVTADLHTAHRPPHGSALGIARPLDSVDDAGKAGNRRGQRGAVDAAEASGPAAHVRHDGNKGAPQNRVSMPAQRPREVRATTPRWLRSKAP
ncbi:hypothetical protein [Streptomyces bottropensis]|uniref:hypothetical protein n=1 Tax=Streptomyces bottropensis TaxID=42235 RepID=UPI003684B3F1